MNITGELYNTKQEDYKTFDTRLASNFIATCNCTNKTDSNKLDEERQGKTNQYNSEELIHACVTAPCDTAFRISKGRTIKTRRTVPW